MEFSRWVSKLLRIVAGWVYSEHCNLASCFVSYYIVSIFSIVIIVMYCFVSSLANIVFSVKLSFLALFCNSCFVSTAFRMQS